VISIANFADAWHEFVVITAPDDVVHPSEENHLLHASTTT
jgi:hypothetical protein